jgi:serine/threonine protein kinase
MLSGSEYSRVDIYLKNDSAKIVVKKIESDITGLRYDALVELNCLYLLKGCTNIIQILEHEITIDDVKIMLEYCDMNLRSYINQNVYSIREKNIYNCINDLMSALKSCHHYNIIHCDIKPENILVNINPIKFILADFGISNISKENRDMVKYTINYTPPELLGSIESQYTEASDIWSLGVTLIEYLIGSPVIMLPRNANYGHVNKAIQKLSLNGYLDINKLLNIDISTESKTWINTLKSMVAINPECRLPRHNNGELIYKNIPSKPITSTNITPSEYFNGIVWMFNIANYISITNTVLFDAVDIMNRYYNIKYLDVKTYHQVILTSMIISMKINDTDTPYINSLIKIADSQKIDIKNTEVDIINLLLPNIIQYHAYQGKTRNELLDIYKIICTIKNQYPPQLSYDEILSIKASL